MELKFVDAIPVRQPLRTRRSKWDDIIIEMIKPWNLGRVVTFGPYPTSQAANNAAASLRSAVEKFSAYKFTVCSRKNVEGAGSSVYAQAVRVESQDGE